MKGIVSYGAYVPVKRLQRAAIHAANKWFAPALAGLAKGERSMADWDEDAITMAVEAARDALTGQDRSAISGVVLASTTLPFAVRQNAGIAKEALNLSDHVSTIDVGGSARVGVTSLVQAMQSGADGLVLHMASDIAVAMPGSEAEMTRGDGAAAFVLGDPDAAVALLVGASSVSVDFVDRFRGDGAETDYFWESRWIRDAGFRPIVGGALRDAIARLDLDPARIDRLVVPTSLRGAAAELARICGIRAEAVEPDFDRTVGDCGNGYPGLMLAAALEKAAPGETIVVAAFGSGCEIAAFRTTDKVADWRPAKGVSGWVDRRRAEENYLKYLCFRGHLEMEKGIRGEHEERQPLSALWRKRKTVLGLVGGRCTVSGTVQFPKSEISVNQNDRFISTQEDYPLADIPARIMTYTADSLTVSAAPPQYYGNIEFEGGGRMMAEMADIGEDAPDVGQEVRMVFRVKGVDERRHFTRYFWKAAPV